MMNRPWLTGIALILLTVGATSTWGDEPPAPETAEAGLFFVFLDVGGSKTPLPREEAARMQAAHLGNLTRLADEGKSPLAGPLGRESKRTRGIVIVRADDAAALAAEFEDDPFVANDYLAIRSYPWRKTVGRFAPVPEKMELGTYTLVVVRVAGETEPAAARKAYGALEASLAKARGDDGAATLLLAGPIVDDRDDDGEAALVGVLLLRIEELDVVNELLAKGAGVAGGHLAVEVHRQYLAKGIVD